MVLSWKAEDTKKYNNHQILSPSGRTDGSIYLYILAPIFSLTKIVIYWIMKRLTKIFENIRRLQINLQQRAACNIPFSQAFIKILIKIFKKTRLHRPITKHTET